MKKSDEQVVKALNGEATAGLQKALREAEGRASAWEQSAYLMARLLDEMEAAGAIPAGFLPRKRSLVANAMKAWKARSEALARDNARKAGGKVVS